MARSPEISYKLRDVLDSKMPVYLVGRLDQIHSTATKFGSVAHLLLLFFSPIILSELNETPVSGWIHSMGVSVDGLCFLAWLSLIPIIYTTIPDRLRRYHQDKIIRLRIALGSWPSIARMPYPKSMTIVTAEKITLAENLLKEEIAYWPSLSSITRDGY